MDKLKECFKHLNEAREALHEADQDEPFEQCKMRIDCLLHLSTTIKFAKELYDIKAGEQV